MSERVAVAGAGSWGTTLANLLAKKGHVVSLWSFEDEVVEDINDSRVNSVYLPDVRLDDRLTATASLPEAVEGADVVLSVSPSQHVRQVMRRAAQVMRKDALVVSASKGIETSTLETMADVLEDVLPVGTHRSTCFLSGPSFATEVAREHPTAVTVAARDGEAAQRSQDLFQTDYFRVYTSHDVIGVELGGALKNVMALAAGMVSGLGFGHNTRAAMITRGLAEMSRLGVALGANPLTFMGLAGMGDLILTCTGDLSRNRSVGFALGQGKQLSEVLGSMRMVAEGVETSRAAHALAQREDIEMPIVAEVHAVLFEDRSPEEAVRNLMLREPKAELWQ
ncbi:MAG: NAD(P)H-dependent glycerol-3-phosphate dehydrogenase [Gemmatimonadetes bacterium]|nr:NAD(P)H-dependent glycerol-3-phosphate dehydrogenase [Gemmatimonadota bacterium]